MVDTRRGLCGRREDDSNSEEEQMGGLEQCFDSSEVRVLA